MQEAPQDGNFYARLNNRWIRITILEPPTSFYIETNSINPLTTLPYKDEVSDILKAPYNATSMTETFTPYYEYSNNNTIQIPASEIQWSISDPTIASITTTVKEMMKEVK